MRQNLCVSERKKHIEMWLLVFKVLWASGPHRKSYLKNPQKLSKRKTNYLGTNEKLMLVFEKDTCICILSITIWQNDFTEVPFMWTKRWRIWTWTAWYSTIRQARTIRFTKVHFPVPILLLVNKNGIYSGVGSSNYL